MSSTAWPASGRAPPTSARRWSTPASGLGRGRATTARTSPRWPTGAGTDSGRRFAVRVLTVNAGSTSLKLREVVDGRAGRSPGSLDEAFGGDPPDAVAHRVVHGGDRTAAEVV